MRFGGTRHNKMGKVSNILSIVIFVDLLFIFFWGGSGSLQSIIANWISDPSNFSSNTFTTALVTTLLISLIGGAIAAAVTFFGGAKTDTILFATFAFGTLYNVGKDILFMYDQVVGINSDLANFIVLPLMIMFAWQTLEWLRAKD